MDQRQAIPVVMAFSGNDPSGGAGIQADIEALVSMGCHAAPVLTALSAQDTRDVYDVTPVPPAEVIEQARAVLEDMTVAAFKIGLLGSVPVIEAVHTILKDYPERPVILDPVLQAGGGRQLADAEALEAMRSLLFPLTTVLTPNSQEARRLAPEADTLEASAQALLAQGCELVLITGTHEDTPQVINVLYGNMRRLEEFTWERLPERYHGSGCTLAASIAGLLAQGQEPFTAIHQAQEYTWESLRHAYQVGRGQKVPNRLFWVRNHTT